MMKSTRISIALSFFFFSSVLVSADNLTKSGVVESLSNNCVWSELQDSRGLMWFGTKEGLNCYNGYENTVYLKNLDDSTSIGDNFIRSLMEVKELGQIWAGSSNGLYIYDMKQDVFSRFDAETEDGKIIGGVVNAMVNDGNDIWISSTKGIVYRYSLSTGELKSYNFDNYSWGMAFDHHGVLWLTSFHNGVYRYIPSKDVFEFTPLYIDNVVSNEYEPRCFFDDLNSDCMWIGTQGKGLIRYNNKTETFKEYMPDKEDLGNISFRIHSVSTLSHDKIALGTDDGVWTFNLISHVFTKILNLQTVFSLVQDREGGLWAGSYYEGVNYLAPDYDATHDFVLPSGGGHVVSSIISTKDGYIWLGTRDEMNGTFSRFDKESGEIKSFADKIPSRNTREMAYIDGYIWIGYYSDGLTRYDPRTGGVQRYSADPQDTTSIQHNSVYSIFKSSGGTMYIGTITGLDILDETTGRFTHMPQISNTRVHSIAEDHYGLIWIATYEKGLACYNPASNEWTFFKHDPQVPDSLPSDKLICLYADHYHKRLFIGTEGSGLCQYNYDSHRFTSVVSDKQLSTGLVCGITSDLQGNLWVSQSHSLNCINLETKQVSTIENIRGQNDIFYTYNGCFTDEDGILYFGYSNGFVTINPTLLQKKSIPPHLMMTGARNYVNATPYDILGPISLDPNEPSISFDFVALSYVSPMHNNYSYYMEGYEPKWEHKGTDRTATYINLPPGKYTFYLKAANSDGVWIDDADIISIPVIVKKVLWLRAYMILLYLLLLAGAFSLSLWILRNNQKRKLENKMFHYRNQNDKEMYQNQVLFFNNIIHEIRTPLSLIKAPLESIIHSSAASSDEETKENMEIMERNVERLHTLADQLLDFRKIEQNVFIYSFKPYNIPEIIQNVVFRFKASCKLKDISLNVVIPEKPFVSVVDSEAITKITSNLLGNALKYANSSISVVLTCDGKAFTIKVSNDGKMIPVEYREKIFQPFFQIHDDDGFARKQGSGIGLALVKSLIEKHNGSVDVVSDAQNTIFTVSIPIVETSIATAPLEKDLIDYSEAISDAGSEDEYTEVNQEFTNTLLIVEDNIELLNFLKNNFARSYNVITANNGKEALAHLEENTIVDVIITDILMPVMDGIALCKAVRDEQLFCHIPIILLTAQTDIRSKTEGLDYGADVFIEKPFSMEFLKAQVTSIIKNRNQLKEMFTSSPLSSAQSIAHNTSDIKFLNGVNEIIMGNLSESGNLIEMVADSMSISRSSFHKKIKAISGMTPNDYIQLIRLKKAAELLSTGDYQISEIAYIVGFNTPSYFSKCFYNQFGMLPRDFAHKTEDKTDETN